MAQNKKTHTIWLHLLPTDIRKEYGTTDPLKRAHDFTIEKMTKSGPTSAVGKTGRVMVKVQVSVDPDIFNQALITALLDLDEANAVPVYQIEVEAPEPLDEEIEEP